MDETLEASTPPQRDKMNNQAFSLAERLIPSTYVQQGLNAKKSRENLIRHFIEHVSLVQLLYIILYNYSNVAALFSPRTRS